MLDPAASLLGNDFEFPSSPSLATKRGMAVPPGTHRVAFEFRPESVRQGMMLSARGVVLIVGSALVLALGGRRAARRPVAPVGTGH